MTSLRLSRFEISARRPEYRGCDDYSRYEFYQKNDSFERDPKILNPFAWDDLRTHINCGRESATTGIPFWDLEGKWVRNAYGPASNPQDHARRPERLPMSRGATFILSIVGILVMLLGIVVTIYGRNTEANFGTDRMCTRSITLASSPRVGATCSIVAGTITRKYRTSDSGRRASEFHIVVASSGRAVLDVSLHTTPASRVFDSAVPGDPAVVETVNGAPAFIATRADSVAASGDPSNVATVGLLTLIFGAVFTFIATRMRSSGGNLAVKRFRS